MIALWFEARTAGALQSLGARRKPYLKAICTLSLEKCLFMCCVQVLIGLSGFLTWSGMVLHILDVNIGYNTGY